MEFGTAEADDGGFTSCPISKVVLSLMSSGLKEVSLEELVRVFGRHFQMLR